MVGVLGTSSSIEGNYRCAVMRARTFGLFLYESVNIHGHTILLEATYENV